jgi:hypothetical protein
MLQCVVFVCVCVYLQAETYITLEATIAVRALPDVSKKKQVLEAPWQKINQTGKNMLLANITDAAPAAPPPLFTLASKTCISNMDRCKNTQIRGGIRVEFREFTFLAISLDVCCKKGAKLVSG